MKVGKSRKTERNVIIDYPFLYTETQLLDVFQPRIQETLNERQLTLEWHPNRNVRDCWLIDGCAWRVSEESEQECQYFNRICQTTPAISLTFCSGYIKLRTIYTFPKCAGVTFMPSVVIKTVGRCQCNSRAARFKGSRNLKSIKLSEVSTSSLQIRVI